MSASSGSDSGGKGKPPDKIKKKPRGKKTTPKNLEPTEEAFLGPVEKAVIAASAAATSKTAATVPAATEAASAVRAAAAATAVAPKVTASTAAAPTATVIAAGARTSAASVSAAADMPAAASSKAAASAATTAATATAATATAATATAATATAAKATAATAAPAAAAVAAAATAAVAVSGAPIAAPRLTEVVKAASAIVPVPRGTIIRPALSGAKPKNPAAAAAPVNGSSSAGVVAGLSYAQQVSATSKKSPFIEIQGRYVAPRQPPSASGKPRPKSDEGLQGLFAGRWQDERYGMCFEQIRGSSQSAYLEAICSVIPQNDIFSFGALDRGMAELYTTNLESATKLMLEGIEVGGRHLTPFPVSVKPTRVVFSRVPMRADNEDLLSFLRMFGKVHGKVRAIPLKIGDKGLGRGIFSTSREAYITLNQGCKLPEGFYLNISGSRSFIEVSTEAKCYACHQVGHFIADCPKRTRKVAESTAGGASATAETPQAVTSPGAAPPHGGQPAAKVPHNPPQEAQKVAGGNISPSMREEASSSDEGQPTSPNKNRRTKRKSKKAPQVMPPPSASAPTKRRLSDEGLEACSSKKAVLSIDNTDLPSESEIHTLDEEEAPTEGGYESCGSTVSMGSHLELDPTLKGVDREKLRSVLDRLHYKKNPDRIWSILKQELGDPLRILPQLLVLLKEAKRRKKFSEASRIERLHSKILEINEERKMDDSLRQ